MTPERLDQRCTTPDTARSGFAIYRPSQNLGELGIRFTSDVYVGFYSRREWARFPFGVFVRVHERRHWITPYTAKQWILDRIGRSK
jgi:hypothetical protein